MGQDIAIIGLACRLPGASNPAELWDLLTQGRDSISFFDDESLDKSGMPPELRRQPNFVAAAGVLPDIEMFDADFFGIPAHEAAVLDPQHRIFLECVWEALEDAGCPPLGDVRDIGVFAGASFNSYLIRNLTCNPQLLSTPAGFMSLIGNEKDYLATRVAYKLDLHGPAITVQTACSTSLVAVHLAMQSLLLGECDVAVAGGVSVKVPQAGGYLHQEGMPFSSDGRCRPFDAQGTGTVFGSGAGVVVLKPLEAAQVDGDHIYAVIRGSACNNDGSRKVGFTAPSVDGQADVIRRALALAEIDAADVGYVEAHGTATSLGDLIEISALQEAYADTTGAARCAVGSIKSNLGHMETAAGVAGLIKTALMLRHRKLVPSLGFEQANPHLALEGSRLSVQTRLEDWGSDAGKARCAALSSFGMGGTNVHMVLQEAPQRTVDPARSRPYAILPFSARTQGALAAVNKSMDAWLAGEGASDIHQVACHLQTRRSALEVRQAMVCADGDDARRILSERPDRLILGKVASARRPLAYVLCGGGAQYPGMTSGLYRAEPFFRDVVDRCAAAFLPLIGHDIVTFLDVAEGDHPAAALRLQDPDVMFPALFAVQHAMAELLASWGIKPDLLIAHSNGEYAAAVAAGVMDLETAIVLVAARARMMMQMKPGIMIAVPLAVQAVQPYVQRFGISIAAENGPRSTALSGEVQLVTAARQALEEEQGVQCRRVHVNAGLHSMLTEDIAAEFEQVVRRYSFRAPTLPWISTVTGTFMDPDKAVPAAYWVRHLCQPVKFSAAAATLLAQPEQPIVVDLGPGRVAGDLLRLNAAGKAVTLVPMGRSQAETAPDSYCAYQALARLWTSGRPVDWTAFQDGARPLKAELPAYPWQRKRHWVEAPACAAGAGTAAGQLEADVQGPEDDSSEADERPNVGTPYAPAETLTQAAVLALWQKFFGSSGKIGIHDNFIDLGGTSLLATQLLASINAEFAVSVRLGTFLDLGNVGAVAREIDAMRDADEARLLEEALREIEATPDPAATFAATTA